MKNGGILYPSHIEGSNGTSSAQLISGPFSECLPASPVVIQNLHFECFGSLSNLKTNAAHANESQSGPRHLLTHPICRKFLCIWCTGQHMT